MNDNAPEFVTCAMDAVEEGIPAEKIREECACRLGLPLAENKTTPSTTPSKE